MIFVEHIKDGIDHIDGNAALIASFLLANSDKEHYFFAGESHFDNVKRLLAKSDLCNNLNLVKIKPLNDFTREYKLLLSDLKIVFDVFNFAKKNRIINITFLYTTTFLLYYIKFLLPFYPDIKVFCMVHGELERIDVKKYSETFANNRILMFLYALVFGLYFPLKLKNSSRLKYLVYGESIRQNAIKIIPKLTDSMIAIPHPVLWEKDIVPQDISNKIVITVPGIVAPRKNQRYLQELLLDLSSIKNIEEKCLFKFAGRILGADFYNIFKNCSFIDKTAFPTDKLSFEHRNSLITECNYTLYTYSKDSYKLIASGAFIDSINFEKPIIAIKNNYIEYYFKKYGDIGYLCDSYDELKEIVLNLIENVDINRYNQQIQNIKTIKNMENIAQISNFLRKELQVIE